MVYSGTIASFGKYFGNVINGDQALVQVSIDFKNAFNTVSRTSVEKGLLALEDFAPIWDFIKLYYLTPSKLWLPHTQPWTLLVSPLLQR
jgi:hypothetical protein